MSKHRIERVISGGQTGADQAGWRAAKRFGIATGGWMPKGYLTEDGPRPEFAEMYGAREHGSSKYPPRTRRNAEWADTTLVFDTPPCNHINDLSTGSQLTIRACMYTDRNSAVIPAEIGEPIGDRRVQATAAWLVSRKIRILNIAGNRESRSPGIGVWVEAYLCEVFRLLGLREIAPAVDATGERA